MFFPIDRPALPKIVAEAPLFDWMLVMGLYAQTSGREFRPLKSSGFAAHYFASYRINKTKPTNEHAAKAISSIPRIRELHCCCSHRSVILGICRPVHELSAHLR
jgi:hypothetical protein